jgi:hypothetical protein
MDVTIIKILTDNAEEVFDYIEADYTIEVNIVSLTNRKLILNIGIDL